MICMASESVNAVVKRSSAPPKRVHIITHFTFHTTDSITAKTVRTLTSTREAQSSAQCVAQRGFGWLVMVGG